MWALAQHSPSAATVLLFIGDIRLLGTKKSEQTLLLLKYLSCMGKAGFLSCASTWLSKRWALLSWYVKILMQKDFRQGWIQRLKHPWQLPPVCVCLSPPSHPQVLQCSGTVTM